MPLRADNKIDNLSLTHGGRYASPCAIAEIELEREIRERCVAVRTTYARNRKDRAIDCIAMDKTHPTRIRARLIRKMKALRVPFDEMCAALFAPELRYAKRVYHQHITGEFPPPDAPQQKRAA